MPQSLTSDEIDQKVDPSVSKQWDDESPKEEQIQDYYKIVDGLKAGLLTTIRPGIGPVARSMAVAKRNGPDFLFIANIHSNKFKDLDHSKQVQVTFQNSSTQDWVSVTGEATTTSNDDPRIKDLYSAGLSAWFGDLGDGVHTGKAEDPRMALIEVKAKYVSYWKTTVSSLGFAKEIGVAALTGKVADTGVLRQLVEKDIELARRQS
jgi:general stress protein 26